MVPWARLELARSYSPRWILSPMRLPIPPPGRAPLLHFQFSAEPVDDVYLTLQSRLLISTGALPPGRAPLLYILFQKRIIVNKGFRLFPRLNNPRSRSVYPLERQECHLIASKHHIHDTMLFFRKVPDSGCLRRTSS